MRPTETISELTPKQRELLRHSLGADKAVKGVAYRNHFYIGPGSDDFDVIESLVAAGLMQKGRRGIQGDTTDYHYYHATQAGMKAVGIVRVGD